MEDPLQLNLDRDNDQIVLRPREGRELPIRAYREPQSPENEPDDLAAVMQYFWILWKHKWVLLLAVALGAGAGLVVALRATPLYSASTSIKIDKLAEPFGQPLVQKASSLDTQIQILLSRTTRTRARLKVPENTDGQEFQAKGLLEDIRHFLKLKDPAKAYNWKDALGVASGSLTVSRPKDSDILILQSLSTDPKAAADYTNTLAQEYIQITKEERWESYSNTGGWMTRAQQELKTKIENAEQQMAQFAKDKGLIFTGGTNNISEERLKQIQTDLGNATRVRIERQADAESSVATSTADESLPSVLASGPMAAYQAKIVDLQQQKAQLLTTLTPENYKVQQVQNQLDSIIAARDAERKEIVKRDRIGIDAAVKKENELRKEFERQQKLLANQSDDLIRYNILQSEIDTNKKLYASMLGQGTEASIASAMRNASVSLIDAATPSDSPIQPNVPYLLTLGMLGGLCCGAGLVILRSRSNLTIQSPGVLEMQLNLRELGVIPSARTDHGAQKLRAFSGSLRLAAKNGNRTLTSADCLEMVTFSENPSAMAEAFRSTMTSILFADGNGERPRTLVFTSASPGEGKSTVISNLAIALAQINQRVLLIDADMRLPRAHAIFDVPNTFGLSDVLHERMPVHDYVEESLVRKTHIPNLYILPAGPARTNLSRLFHSARMQELLLRFRDSFDIVLIDTAPVLIVPDSRILARSADAVVLVVRAHQTHQQAAFAAASHFANDGTRILGTILNDWNPKMSTQQYGGYYGHNGYYPKN